jgi:hypothetical protein
MQSEKAIMDAAMMDTAMMLFIRVWNAAASKAFHTLPRDEQAVVLRSSIMHEGIMLVLKEALSRKAEEIQHADKKEA